MSVLYFLAMPARSLAIRVALVLANSVLPRELVGAAPAAAGVHQVIPFNPCMRYLKRSKNLYLVNLLLL